MISSIAIGQVYCKRCDRNWAKAKLWAAPGSEDDAANSIVADCPDCNGTYRTPIPMAEVMGGYR